MRRKDREITDYEKIDGIIARCYCCRIGFNDGGEVYIVPLNFGYERKGGLGAFYFHGASEGRKVELIKSSPRVGFELDTNYALNEGDAACEFSARFQSVIGNGVMSIVTDPDEKKQGLSLIMDHAAGKKGWEFDEKMLRAVAVFKLEITKLSCKEHK